MSIKIQIINHFINTEFHLNEFFKTRSNTFKYSFKINKKLYFSAKQHHNLTIKHKNEYHYVLITKIKPKKTARIFN